MKRMKTVLCYYLTSEKIDEYGCMYLYSGVFYCGSSRTFLVKPLMLITV